MKLNINKIKFIGLLFVIFFSIVFTIVTINTTAKGNIDLTTEGVDIPIEISGKKYNAPTKIENLKPGKYLISTKSDYFINKNFEIEVKKNQTTKYKIDLEARLDEEAMDIEEKKWDFDKLGEEQDKINEVIVKNNPLTKYLPYETELFSFDYTSDPNGNVSYFIAMNDRDNETETIAKNEVNNYISSKGLNPVSITYTWTSR